MRDIKFRAWQPHASLHRQPGMYLVDDMVWHKVTDEQPNEGEVFLTKEIGASRSSEFFEDVVLMQYTGLKDKNGVEIYEGDIVTKHPEYYRTSDIVFDDWTGSLRFRADEDDENLELTKHYCGHMEIIGNIYENPELLEKSA